MRYTVLYVGMALGSMLGCGDDNQSDTDSQRLDGNERISWLIQNAIDFEPLQEFFHPELEDRQALCLTGSELPDGLALQKHGQPVRIVLSEEECANCITVRTITVENGKAEISIDYPIEGITCDLKYEWNQVDWTLISSSLQEY